MTEGAVEVAAEAGLIVGGCDGAGEVRLVEEGDDSVALFKASNAGAGSDDGAGAIGGGHSGEGDWEGVFSLRRETCEMSIAKGKGLERRR